MTAETETQLRCTVRGDFPPRQGDTTNRAERCPWPVEYRERDGERCNHGYRIERDGAITLRRCGEPREEAHYDHEFVSQRERVRVHVDEQRCDICGAGPTDSEHIALESYGHHLYPAEVSDAAAGHPPEVE